MKTSHFALFCVAVIALTGCFKADVNLNMPSNGGGSGNGGTSASQLPGGWQEAASGVFMDAEHGMVFYAFDTLAYPGQPVQLAAKLQKAKSFSGIKDVKIAFYDEQEKLAAVAVTDDKGLAAVEWTPPAAGNYSFTAKIVKAVGDDAENIIAVTPAPLLVSAHEQTDEFVVIDLDHTVVASGFFSVLMGSARPMADSVEVTHRIARSYDIIYLTHRPDLLTKKSKGWLSQHGYPTGPLLVSELKDAFGDSGKFKTAKLSALRKAFPNVKTGIGDKYSDAQVYIDNGLTAYLIPYYKEKPKDMRKAAREISSLDGKGRLNVVSDWRQIEQGIFEGKKFPPETFVKQLESRAKAIEQREKEEDD